MNKKYSELDDSDYEDKSFESDGQMINYKTSTIDEPVGQQFTNLNTTDKEFIKYSLGDADDLLKTLSETKNISNYTAKDLDELLYLWNNKRHNFKHFEESQFVNAIGTAFGELLNKELDTTWTIISDEYGTDYACIGTTHNFQLFPFSSVWKAIEQSREDSLNAIILLVKKNIDDWDTK